MPTRRSFITLGASAAFVAACGTPRPPAEQSARSAVAPARQTPVRVTGSGTVLPAVQKLAEGYEKLAPDAKLEIVGGTSSGSAIRGVLEGTLEIALVNRPLSEAETREPLQYTPFVRDAVAFAVHQPAPVQGLTSAQLREIYDGTVTNWRGVGGPDAPVIVLDRDADETMRKLALVPFLAGRSVVAGAVTLTSASEMLAALDSTPNAVGYSSLGLIRLKAPKGVVPLALDSVMPSGEAIASGAYPWSLTFGLVTHADAGPAIRAFVDHVVRSSRSVLGPFEYEALSG